MVMTSPFSMSGTMLERLPGKNSSLAVMGRIHAEFYRKPEENPFTDTAGEGQEAPSSQAGVKEAAPWHMLEDFICWLCGFEPERR